MKTMETGEKIRLDKWLWHARFFKTRSLAAKICKAGKVRINGAHAVKPSSIVKPGDVLTFSQADAIKVIKVLSPGVRRGPAVEAQTLYEDQSPAMPKPGSPGVQEALGRREMGTGRPTKADRRAIDKLQSWD